MINKGSSLFRATGIVTIVIGGISCFGFLAIFPLILGVALILGGVNFLKYAEYTKEDIEKEKAVIIIWIVVFFIFGWLIAGILALVAYLTAVNADQTNTVVVKDQEEEKKADQTQADLKIEKLEKLENLKQQGLLTEEEFELLKKELLGK